MDKNYYSEIVLKSEEDVIDLAYHIIDCKDLDTKTFLSLMKRVKESCTPTVSYYFSLYISDTFSPRSHTLKTEKLEACTFFPDRQKWLDSKIKYPFDEEVTLSDIEFHEGYISYKGRTFKSVRIHGVNKNHQKLVERPFKVRITSRTNFHFEPYSDLQAAIKSISNATYPMLKKTEAEAIKVMEKLILEDLRMVKIYAEIHLNELSINGTTATFNVDQTNIVSKNVVSKYGYNEFVKEVGRIRHRDYPALKLKRILRHRAEYDSFKKNLEERFFEDFSQTYSAEFDYYTDSLSWFIQQFVPICVSADHFIGYVREHVAFQREPRKDLSLFGQSHSYISLTKQEVDELLNNCKNAEYRTEYDSGYHYSPIIDDDDLRRVNRAYPGMKELMTKKLEGMVSSSDFKMIEDVSQARFKPEFLSKGRILYFRELTCHYSDDVLVKDSTSVFLNILDSAIWMYPHDSSKAIYIFYINPEQWKDAVFFIWSYFTSLKNNRREMINEILDYAENFGIRGFLKQENDRCGGCYFGFAPFALL